MQEQLVHACRSNNLEILNEIIGSYSGKEAELAQLLNSTTSVLGNYLYHEAALKGNGAFSISSTLFLGPR